MSSSSGPSSATSGLLLDIDMSNTQKSWKGAPSTNLLTYSQNYAGSGWGYYATAVAQSTSVSAPDSTLTAWALSGDATSSYHELHQTFAFIAGTTYTFSFYVRAGSRSTPFTQFNPASFGNWITTTYDLIAGTSTGTYSTITNVGNGWFRCTLTATATISATSPVYIYPYGSPYVGPGITTPEVYVWGCQLEVGSFATPYIPTTTTSASRSSSQSFIDLTNRNVLTSNAITYNTDGTFEFNGSTSGYIESATSSALQPSQVTVDAWIKQTGASQPMGFVTGNGDTGNYGYWLSVGASLINWSIGTGTGFNQQNYGAYLNNVTAHVCCTYNGATSCIYINGVLTSSNTVSSGSIAYNNAAYLSKVRIGDLNGSGGQIANRMFIGKIYSVKIYDHALTASEVAQNFNAIRGRYGI
jgi:hypothetical protein